MYDRLTAKYLRELNETQAALESAQAELATATERFETTYNEAISAHKAAMDEARSENVRLRHALEDAKLLLGLR